MNPTDLTPERRELAHRFSSGIDVRLVWNPADDTLAVTVFDELGESFELAVASHEALDAYHHPYAYATSGRRRESVEVAATRS